MLLFGRAKRMWLTWLNPANTRLLSYKGSTIVLMLGRRCRRWRNTETTVATAVAQRLVFARK